MRLHYILILSLFTLVCSKVTEIPETELSDTTFSIYVYDANNFAFTSGYVKVRYLDSGNATKSKIGPLGANGKIDFLFKKDEFDNKDKSIKITEILIFNCMLELLNKIEDDITILTNDPVFKEYGVDEENREVYWERFDFSNNYNLEGKKILAVLGDDFNYLECFIISSFWEYYGADVQYASYKNTVSAHILTVSGKSYSETQTNVRIENDIADINPSDFDCIFFPGGNGPEDLLSNYPEIKNFVLNAYNNTVLISAICHGPLVLAESGIIEGKAVTGYIEIKSILEDNGGIYVSDKTVTDGNLITGNWPYFYSFAAAAGCFEQNESN